MSKDSPFKEIGGIMYRKCSKCQEYKVFDDFSKCKSRAFGIQNECKVCVKKYQKEYQEQNKEKIKEYRRQNKEKMKEYYEQNKDKMKEYRRQNKEKIKEYRRQNKEKMKEYRRQNKDKMKEYRRQNKEKIKEYRRQNKDKMKEYYEQNKERVKEYQKEYHEQNKDKMKEYCKKYRDNIKNKYGVSENTLRYRKDESFRLQCILRSSNRKNLKRALEYYNNGKIDLLPSKSPSRLLLKLYEIQNHNCPYCSNNMKDDVHIDHIIPLSKNGSNEVHNLILCCSNCNLRKNAKELNIWLNECNINYDDFISDIERRNKMYLTE